jgi:phosphoglycerol transferase MdoB-like AlkP superfamily enzyme
MSPLPTSSPPSLPRRLFDALFPGRFAPAGIVLVGFMLLGLATRIGLALFNGLQFGDWSPFAPQRVAGWLLVGALFDLGVGAWVMLPLALLAWLAPDTRRGALVLRWIALPLALLLAAGLVFVAASEFVFWNEFGTRFNFIAVDYLVYTTEVIGNIRQSYSMPLLLSAVGLAALAFFALGARPLWRATRPVAGGSRIGRRSARLALLALLPAVSVSALDVRLHDFTDNLPSAQLAGNGIFEFLHAFRNNEIDYAQFYKTQAPEATARVLRQELAGGAPHAQPAALTTLPLEREVVAPGPMKRLNVVLVSVESLSADFMAAFGNTDGITPRLDALARESLFFTDLYATGTRTVRGLEALTLSVPPTPGHSIVKRPDNANLFTLGGVFAAQGYEPIYLYGGYSYFDNMEAFFGGNGYTVIDRSSLAKDEISYENIWGVADEDLFKLALRELDKRHAAGRPFFAHVMTTSNHRPYSYPQGRIDIAPGTGRNGAVKYTDWAIGRFIDAARGKPWFDDTVFVIVADHCASSRGKSDLPPDRFHIPLLVYAPKHIAPRRVDTMASQIDVGPTLLALLNVSYRSKFFGRDILADGAAAPRALLANYQTVGLLQPDALVELRPKRQVRVVDPATGAPHPADAAAEQAVQRAIAYYEGASTAFRSGALRKASAPVGVAAAAAGTALH